MARPRKDSTDPSAIERIITAFWELMEELPYKSITVAALIKRANVSPNTLYYHFKSFTEVVQTALDETLDPKLLENMISGARNPSAKIDADIANRLFRIMLFASKDSGELNTMLRDTLKSKWLEEMGISERELTQEESLELDFIFAGVTTLLASKPADNIAGNQILISQFFSRPLGTGILSTIKKIADK